MPDTTTPDDRFDARAEEISGDSPWVEDSSEEPSLDEVPLDEAARAEVAAFRDNLEAGSVAGDVVSEADDRGEVSRQLQAHRHGLIFAHPDRGFRKQSRGCWESSSFILLGCWQQWLWFCFYRSSI